MLKLAFCDDNVNDLQELSRLSDRYRLARGVELSCAAYRSPLELLTVLERGERYDVIFLDVMMPGENGLETAREIRALDRAVKLVFVTSTSEFAVQSYSVNAFFYQLKPVGEEAFFRLMDEVREACGRQERDGLILKCDTGLTWVDLSQLVYCEVTGRQLTLHLSGGKALQSFGHLDELERQVAPRGGFLRPHRSYLVNMDYIQDISYRSITLSTGDAIPVPRGRFAPLKDAFLEHAFRKGQAVL